MRELFKKKLSNIHSNLLERYRDSQHYTAPIVGAEREAVKKELLSVILPPGYRIGSGTIVDARDGDSGQVDAVIEQPFSLSFPIASDVNRLYLAQTVAAAFEIKSDLDNQGQAAMAKVEKIRRRLKKEIKDDEIVMFDRHAIPTFIVGYTGPKTIQTVEKNFIDPRNRFAPTGVLIIESEIFYGRAPGGSWHIAEGKETCILAFFSCLVSSLQYSSQQEVDLLEYLDIAKS